MTKHEADELRRSLKEAHNARDIAEGSIRKIQLDLQSAKLAADGFSKQLREETLKREAAERTIHAHEREILELTSLLQDVVISFDETAPAYIENIRRKLLR